MINIRKRNNNHQTIKDFIAEHKILVLFSLINVTLLMSSVIVYILSFSSIKSLQKEYDSLRQEYKDVKKSNTIIMINKDDNVIKASTIDLSKYPDITKEYPLIRCKKNCTLKKKLKYFEF